MAHEEDEGGMDFRAIPVSPEQLMGFLKAIKGAVGVAGGALEKKRGGKKVKLTSEEVARFKVLECRSEALKKALDVGVSKLRIENDRIWADLREKYELFGMDLTYDGDEGTIHEAK